MVQREGNCQSQEGSPGPLDTLAEDDKSGDCQQREQGGDVWGLCGQGFCVLLQPC